MDRQMNRRQLLALGAQVGKVAVAASLFPSILTACGPSQGGAAVGPNFKVDVEQAKKEGKLLFYTSLDPKMVEKIIAAFKAKYGIEVEYFRAGSAQVSNKVFTEAEAGGIKADTIDISDVAAFLAMKEKGLLQPYKSAHWDKIAREVQDPDYHYIGCRLTMAVIGHNTQLVKGDMIPKSYADLKDPKYAGKLVFFNTAGDGAPRLYALVKAFGWEYLEALAKQKPMMVATPQVSTQFNESGERPVSFATNDNLLYDSRAKGRPVDIVWPSDGVPIEPGACAVIKATKKPHGARLWLDWWIGPEAQNIIVEYGKWSPRPDIEPPKGNPKLSTLKLLATDYNEFMQNRSDILKRMGQIFGGQW